MTGITATERPRVVPRGEWLAARMQLLAQEKECNRALDAVTAARRALPMVEIDKDYTFTGPQGTARLVDLFDGRQQLITYHFMWMPEADEGCPSCSFTVDNVGDLVHLHASDTSLALVSRAPLASIQRFQNRMGWTLPWYSSSGSDFNYDFQASSGDADTAGLSVFLRDDDDRVFHTYSTYGRGTEVMLSTYHYLDLTPLGRQRTIDQFPHHDRYR
jgi:predicted dithiol-disulfide oxidoreductase (DUF899 family)